MHYGGIAWDDSKKRDEAWKSREARICGTCLVQRQSFCFAALLLVEGKGLEMPYIGDIIHLYDFVAAIAFS